MRGSKTGKAGIFFAYKPHSILKKDIAVPILPKFERKNWRSILKAFVAAPVMKMTQGWLKRQNKGIPGTTVRLGWRGNALHILAHLPDGDIFNHSTRNNQNLCLFGDVFEIFLRDISQKTYHEFHIAPNGRWMQLKMPSAEFFRRGGFDLDSLRISRRFINFRLRIDRRANYWMVYASIPLSRLPGKKTAIKDRVLMASFSRYDYSGNKKKPILSSTSAHRIPHFHRQQEWQTLHFI